MKCTPGVKSDILFLGELYGVSIKYFGAGSAYFLHLRIGNFRQVPGIGHHRRIS